MCEREKKKLIGDWIQGPIYAKHMLYHWAASFFEYFQFEVVESTDAWSLDAEPADRQDPTEECAMG